MDFLIPNPGNAPAIPGTSYAHTPHKSGLGHGSAHEKSLVIRALMMAVNLRKPPPGLIHHSDRGSQYASHAYQALLKKHGMIGSMSRKGNLPPEYLKCASEVRLLKVCNRVYSGHYSTWRPVVIQQKETTVIGHNPSFVKYR